MRTHRLFLAVVMVWCLFLQTASAQPPYAKWGRLAINETQKHYPQAQIIDYLHIGRESLDNNQSRENFRLWLRQNQKEWGVLVSITFDTRTEQLISIKIND
ncbi:YqzG/YhdC family protein [Brevibacillus ginsengisoli]|uniref:YqzG/YhdC family protein n=1 Tax=Brevibacillus ginsengisoli TaxID=363854 RepID=UPI003CF1B05D